MVQNLAHISISFASKTITRHHLNRLAFDTVVSITPSLFHSRLKTNWFVHKFSIIERVAKFEISAQHSVYGRILYTNSNDSAR